MPERKEKRMPTKVLLIDDEPDVLRLIETKFEKLGFQVIATSDGEEGLAAARAEKPDVIILDLMLPKGDGYTLLHTIKTEWQPAPIAIVLTAKDGLEDMVRALTGGADDYITKPFSPRDLISRVNVALIKAGKLAHLEPTE